MNMDHQYKNMKYLLSEHKHSYGNNIHLLSSPYILSLLADLGHPMTGGSKAIRLVQKLYSFLLDNFLSHGVEWKQEKVETRMTMQHPSQFYVGPLLPKETSFVVADIARAGIIPSLQIYQELADYFHPECIRQDHLYLAREKKGDEVSINCSGSKIGGDKNNRIVIIPDPMGATGETIKYCLDHYEKHVPGKVKKFVALHLMVTPEYIKEVQKLKIPFDVYALRIDRGASDESVTKLSLGEKLDKEFGLDDNKYIVPGAGGVGEVLNNSWV